MAQTGGVAGDRLKTLIERIEYLEQEKANIAEDVRDVYAEAKSAGFDPKIMRKIIAMRKLDPHDRAEQQTLMETYLRALGMAFEEAA